MEKNRLNQYADRKKGIFKACQLGAHFLSSISARSLWRITFPLQSSLTFFCLKSPTRDFLFPFFHFIKRGREGGKKERGRKTPLSSPERIFLPPLRLPDATKAATLERNCPSCAQPKRSNGTVE